MYSPLLMYLWGWLRGRGRCITYYHAPNRTSSVTHAECCQNPPMSLVGSLRGVPGNPEPCNSNSNSNSKST
jgi:hypothetical protein